MARACCIYTGDKMPVLQATLVGSHHRYNPLLKLLPQPTGPRCFANGAATTAAAAAAYLVHPSFVAGDCAPPQELWDGGYCMRRVWHVDSSDYGAVLFGVLKDQYFFVGQVLDVP